MPVGETSAVVESPALSPEPSERPEEVPADGRVPDSSPPAPSSEPPEPPAPPPSSSAPAEEVPVEEVTAESSLHLVLSAAPLLVTSVRLLGG
jgi:hypothetical protein